MDKPIQQILDDPNEWGGGEWELSFQLPLLSLESAAKCIVSSPKLFGWWQCYEPEKRTYAAQIQLLDIVGSGEEGGVHLKGVALIDGTYVACLFMAAARKINNDLPLGIENARDGIVLLQIPMPSLARAFDWDWEGEPNFVTSLMDSFKELALEICQRFPVLLCMLGDGVTYSENLKVSDLYSPYDGYILPKDHALANSPGGVPFLENYVLFDWNLTQDSDNDVKG